MVKLKLDKSLDIGRFAPSSCLGTSLDVHDFLRYGAKNHARPEKSPSDQCRV
jgi:hypothetical protein